MTTYDQCLAERAATGETNDCSVIAVACACNIPYATAHEYLRKLGRKRGQGHNAVTTEYYSPATGRHVVTKRGFLSFLPTLGYQVTRVSGLNGSTVNNIVAKLDPDKTYMVHVRNHVLAIVRGEVMDWTKGRRHRVKAVHEITPL